MTTAKSPRAISCNDAQVLDNPNLVRSWHGVTALVIAAALVAQTVLTLDESRSVVNLFSYFTIQSNILVLVSCVLIALDPTRDGPVFQAVRIAGLVGITVTGVVYQLLLVGSIEMEGLEVWLDFAFHRFAPVAAVLGFVLLQPRTQFDRRAWWFMVWAFGWLAYTLIRAEVADPVFTISDTDTAPVPYGFLDASDVGWPAVIAISAGITVAAMAVAALYFWIASMPRRSATSSNT